MVCGSGVVMATAIDGWCIYVVLVVVVVVVEVVVVAASSIQDLLFLDFVRSPYG